MFYDRILEAGLIFLLLYTPLAFGAVTEYAQFLMTWVGGLLFFVWLLRSFSNRHRIEGYQSGETHSYIFSVRIPPALIPLCLIALLYAGQRLPLPAGIVRIVSPQRYAIALETASSLARPLPDSLTLSVVPQATEQALFLFLGYAGVFFLLVNILRTPQQIRRITLIILGMGFFEALYGILQMFVDQPLLPFYKPFPWARGTFIVHNHFAGYLEMCLLTGFGVLTAGVPRPQSVAVDQMAAPVERYAKKFLLFTVLLVLLTAQFLSASRGGLASLSIGLLIFLLLMLTRKLLRRWIFWLLLLIPVLCLGVMLLAPAQVVDSLTRFEEYQFDPSWRTRWEIWRTQWMIFRNFPIVGAGFGTFSHIVQRYQTFLWNMRVFYSESDLMQLLAEGGAVGISLTLWLAGVFFYRTLVRWKQRRSRWAVALTAGYLSALTSLLAHSTVDFNFHIPSNALLFTVIAALAYVTVHTREHRHT